MFDVCYYTARVGTTVRIARTSRNISNSTGTLATAVRQQQQVANNSSNVNNIRDANNCMEDCNNRDAINDSEQPEPLETQIFRLSEVHH
jgi:hypothetical protein